MIKKTTGGWAEWPECPQCHERREAQCTGCSAHGTDFRLADFDEPEEPGEGEGDADVLLLCSTCDEPFTPIFYRHCAECGHDFGAGVQREEVIREELNSRVVIVIIGTVLLLVGLFAFFAVVLR